MEAHKDRIAARIRLEAAKRGEGALELARVLDVYPTTVERWFRGERMPQGRHRRELCKHWELPLETLEFNLEAEEEDVRSQLDRIERELGSAVAKLNALLELWERREAELAEDDARRKPEPGEHQSPEQEQA
jgi:transcriptional regulator with XRE-family HTH domain